MDKHEFKRIWRIARSAVAEGQVLLGIEKKISGSFSLDLERGAGIVAGYTQSHRSIAVHGLTTGIPGRHVGYLTSGHPTYTTKTDRRETVKFARQSGRIPLPLEART